MEEKRWQKEAEIWITEMAFYFDIFIFFLCIALLLLDLLQHIVIWAFGEREREKRKSKKEKIVEI